MQIFVLFAFLLATVVGCGKDDARPKAQPQPKKKAATKARIGAPDAGAVPVKPDKKKAKKLSDKAAKPDKRDAGRTITDAQAALFDEELCKEACAHLYKILVSEQKEKLAKEPEALSLFLEELQRIRPQRERKCIRECRKYADLKAVECVTAATKREQLDSCDF